MYRKYFKTKKTFNGCSNCIYSKSSILVCTTIDSISGTFCHRQNIIYTEGLSEKIILLTVNKLIPNIL